MSTKPQQETLGFQTEVKKLLDLVVNSLYSNKEIFLRELVSNSSDALEKLRFETLSDAALYENDSELKIKISFDHKERTLTISDNGIGMTRDEVIENLGTIASSGTRKFLDAISGSGDDKSKNSNLIGQFGVGFYSSFIVSDKVIVKSRRAGMLQDQGVLWESQGKGEYTITNIEKSTRGTDVILHLKKDDADDFLNAWRLQNIITKYSDHILFPILMEKPIDDEKGESKEQEEAVKEEQINRATALWTLQKKDITEEDYNEFYKHISHDFETPLLSIHNHVEGKSEYINLLYIPQRAPFDIWQREHTYGLKLYVQRVFIMDNTKDLLPNYLRFVRGIVDSKDLPLNVSREILQNNRIIEVIKSGIEKRVLDTLEKLSKDDPEKYSKFWTSFGQLIKEGPSEDPANKERISKLFRFASTHTNTEEQNVSLEDYINRMQEGQEKIYYIIAENFHAAQNSPHLEIFRKKNIEVLLLSDRIDEWLMAHITEYNGKQFQSVTKSDIDIGKLQNTEEKERQKAAQDELAPFLERVKSSLPDKIKEAKLSSRLTDSPACLSTENLSSHLQRMLKAAGQSLPEIKPILEINPEHPIIQKLQNEHSDEAFQEWTEFLFAQAVLAEGSQLENPADFVKLVNKMLIEQ